MSVLGRVFNLLGSAPVSFSSGSNLHLPVLTGGGGPEKYMKAYGSVGILFSITSQLANSTAQVDWRLYRKAASGLEEDRTPVRAHAALDLVNKPNPFYRRRRLVESGQQHVDLTGEGWLILGFNPMAPMLPLEMWVVRPDRMAPVPDAEKFIKGYVYTAPNGQQVPFDPHEVIPLQMPNPLDPYRGLGPVQSVLTDLDSSKYSAEWNRNFFLNSAQPGGVIEVPEALSDPDYDRLRIRWSEQHHGVRKAHHVAILEHGKWVPVGYSMKDMQFAELREVSRDTIMEAFGMGKPMLGITDDVNRANADAAELVYSRWRLVPRLERWKEAFNTLLYRFYDPGETLEFDYDNPVPPDLADERADLTARVAALNTLLANNVPIDQACLTVGLPVMTQAGTDGGTLTPDQQAIMIQKIYLGVGVVVTWDEARAILAAAGVPLDLSVPAPAAAIQVPSQRVDDPKQLEDSARRRQLPATRADAAERVLARNRHRDDAPIQLAVEPSDFDLTDVQDDWSEHLAELLTAWSSITASQRAALVDQIETAIDDGDVEGLSALELDSSDAAAELLASLDSLADVAAGRVVEEADDQGVTLDPVTPDTGVLSEIATVTAALLAVGMALSAGTEALRVYRPGVSGESVASAVNKFLRGLTDAQPAEKLGGALTGAQNSARVATIAGGPKASVYAIEVLDTATCGPCKKIDGKWLGNSNNSADLRAVSEVYPNGGYVDCEGRNRCRGTVVGVWE